MSYSADNHTMKNFFAVFTIVCSALLLADCSTVNVNINGQKQTETRSFFSAKKSSVNYSGRNSAKRNAPSKQERRMTLHTGDSIVDIAEEYLGTPYYWGGTKPSTGFDCSGFTSYVYKRAGYEIPRETMAQYKDLNPVRKPNPGDLVFFKINGKNISHVGIYTGDGKFIHSPRTGTTVSFAELGNDYWKKRYAGSRSYFSTN